MLISLREICEHTGKTEVHRGTPGLTDIQVRDREYPITEVSEVEVAVTNTGSKVLKVTGEGYVKTGIPCDRCLKEVSVKIPYLIDTEIDMKKTEEERIKELDEHSYLTGTNLDVDHLVCLEVLMNWPVKVLCKEDCKGICSQCGKDLNNGPCGCGDYPKDPRMAAISDIFNKFKEV